MYAGLYEEQGTTGDDEDGFEDCDELTDDDDDSTKDDEF